MRYDSDFAYFTKDSSWYTFAPGVGYLPTDRAPADAVPAMERFNQRTYHTSPKRFRRMIRLTQRHPRLAAAMVGWRRRLVRWIRLRRT